MPEGGHDTGVAHHRICHGSKTDHRPGRGPVRYKFDFAELKGEYYAPQWQGALDLENATIRQGVVKIMKGDAGPKVEPITPETTRGAVTICVVHAVPYRCRTRFREIKFR